MIEDPLKPVAIDASLSHRVLAVKRKAVCHFCEIGITREDKYYFRNAGSSHAKYYHIDCAINAGFDIRKAAPSEFNCIAEPQKKEPEITLNLLQARAEIGISPLEEF